VAAEVPLADLDVALDDDAELAARLILSEDVSAREIADPAREGGEVRVVLGPELSADHVFPQCLEDAVLHGVPAKCRPCPARIRAAPCSRGEGARDLRPGRGCAPRVDGVRKLAGTAAASCGGCGSATLCGGEANASLGRGRAERAADAVD